MKLLLDTCSFLWMCASPKHLSEVARESIEACNEGLVLNQISAWEMQLKYQKGQLELKTSPRQIVNEACSIYPIEWESISNEAIWHLQKLPDIHRDPFDRLLIAHALIGGHRIVTPDPMIHKYPVACLW